MRNVLIGIGLLVSLIVVIVLQALLVWYSNKPEIWMSYWLGYENIKLILIIASIIFLGHISFVVWAARSRKVEWHWAIPLTIMPYMIGVIIQGLLF